jgi:hypothetical protein
MGNIKQIFWSEIRDMGGLGRVCFYMVGELSPEGWEFSEREAFECVWYPVKPTKELEAKAVAELNKQQSVQSIVYWFPVPETMVKIPNTMIDEREKKRALFAMPPAAA